MSEFTLFGVKLAETTAKAETVTVTPAIAEMFAGVVTHLSGQPNTKNMSFELPEIDADGNPTPSPESFRAMVVEYARTHNLAYGLPKWAAAHRSADKVDKSTGKITPGKDVPDNGKPKHWNVGRNVTFRFAPHAPKSDVDTKTVTVTSAANVTVPAPVK
jgi:hypothetical protein